MYTVKRLNRRQKIERILEYMEKKQKELFIRTGWENVQFTALELSQVVGVTKSTRFMQFLEDMAIDGLINIKRYDSSQVGYKFGYTVYTLRGNK